MLAALGWFPVEESNHSAADVVTGLSSCVGLRQYSLLFIFFETVLMWMFLVSLMAGGSSSSTEPPRNIQVPAVVVLSLKKRMQPTMNHRAIITSLSIERISYLLWRTSSFPQR